MAKNRFYSSKPEGFYEGMNASQKLEAKDGAQVPSGKGKIANMPTEVVIKDWEGRTYVMTEEYGDSKKSIDKQIEQDMSKLKSIMNKR